MVIMSLTRNHIFSAAKVPQFNKERYRSGHNGTDSKSVDGQPSVGSNPTRSATIRGQERFLVKKPRDFKASEALGLAKSKGLKI